MENEEGIEEIDYDKVKEIVVNFYKKLFSKQEVDNDDYGVGQLRAKKKINEEQREKLIATVTEEEIQKVVFAMKNGKAPGPDRFNAEFFKKCWDIVGKDMIQAIKYCSREEFMYYLLNSTIITLVPNAENAVNMTNFKLISCCNLVYKCYSSILTNKLKGTFHLLISKAQNAFVKGR